MKKRFLIPFILVTVFIAGLMGFQYLGAATYTQPLYGSYDLVPTADSTDNVAQRDVVGNKEDAAASGAVSTTESIMAYIKQVVGGQITVDSNVDALAASANSSFSHPNYLAVTTGTFDTTGTWSTVAAHEIAVVTGMVRMLIIPECTASVTSVSDTGTISLGDETTVDSIIADSTLGSGAMVTGELWVDTTLTRTILTRTQLNAIEIVVANGKDIGYTVGTNALSSGSMTFHIYWTPLDSTGAVTAGEGGPFS